MVKQYLHFLLYILVTLPITIIPLAKILLLLVKFNNLIVCWNVVNCPSQTTVITYPIAVTTVLCHVNGVQRDMQGFRTGMDNVWIQMYDDGTGLQIFGDGNRFVAYHYILTIGI